MLEMPSYEFLCSSCNLTFVMPTREPVECPMGHPTIKRQWGFAGFIRSMPAHFSPAVGRYVTNTRDFDDGLKAASEKASEELGTEHRFVRGDMADRDLTKVTNE